VKAVAVCTISSVIYASFDRELSSFLHATRGKAFPRIVVTVHEQEEGAEEAPELAAEEYFNAVPAALAWIADRACGGGEAATLRFRTEFAGGEGGGEQRRVTAGDIRTLRSALDIVAEMADPSMVEITGDFDTLAVNPPADCGLRRARIDFESNMMTVPSADSASDSAQFSLYQLAEETRSNPIVKSYVRRIRDSVTASKRLAVEEFRFAAEDQILKFDQALGGKPLTDFRAEVANGLVARLKVGLGDELRGLSAHARAIAFDWTELARQGAGGGRSRSHVIAMPRDPRDGPGAVLAPRS
jgi:hypothetical protein